MGKTSSLVILMGLGGHLILFDYLIAFLLGIAF